jgi:hypothetical protein
MTGDKTDIRAHAEPELTTRQARAGSAPAQKRTLAALAAGVAAAAFSLAIVQPAKALPGAEHRSRRAAPPPIPASKGDDFDDR